MRTFFPSETRGDDNTVMAPKSTTRDSAISLPPVVGFGLIVAITLTAGIAIGLLAVTIVG
ncbi:hypothetical protein [Natronorubrum halophilum]|uniref:hypothetical protein n=1 Tax=Natronorubrum halophilum TaxID=1702106 RepID=UPI0013CF26C9|nr:hypothetical protein [Natronorubrum halophilum]